MGTGAPGAARWQWDDLLAAARLAAGRRVDAPAVRLRMCMQDMLLEQLHLAGRSD